MQILSYNDGYLTTSEVYTIVQKRRENKLNKKGVDYAGRNWIDHKVVQYCEKTNQTSTAEAEQKCLKELQDLKFYLSKEELVQILNLKPKQHVDIYLIVEDCSDRFTDEQLDQMLQIVNETIITIN